MKIITGIEASCFKVLADHILDESQLVTLSNSRIHHGINQIRDCISTVSREKGKGAVCDLDFQQGFDHLCMLWVRRVLK